MERRTRGASLQGKKRILFAFALIAVAMVLLLFRTAWIQVVKAEEYTDKAKDQQTSDIPVEAKRGAIYDRNGKELATSATCYTLWVRPAQIRENYKTDEKRQELASALAVILEFDSGDIIHAFESESVLVRLANYLEKEQATQIRDMEVYGLELSEDTKRFYPMGDFASILLGSVNDDGVGRSGIELQYNEYLSGIAGRAVMDTDISGNQLSFGQDKYYEAEDGLNVRLTIDEVLQHYLQDAIQKGYQDTGAERVFAVAMDPKTAEVLAMAVTPSFDPNEPTKPSDAAELEIFSELSLEEQSAYLSRMWRNPLISDVYEPGSTMKLITSSSSLEEGIVTPQTGFYCSGVYELYGVEMYDAEHHVHGQESLIQAVGNSCNPVHIQLALMLGAERFLSYIEKYGLTEPTGIDLPGESGSLVGNLDTIGPVELANMGFGQGLAITPLQLATAVCAIANDGVLMKPHCVSALTDKDGNAVVEYKPEVVRKVISHDTAAEMMDIM
ncbi:MAG: stage V sporulation protein D, partial [Eubacterium sp.]|nr:stage V sporulation protein D [Eubacterium sp.]